MCVPLWCVARTIAATPREVAHGDLGSVPEGTAQSANRAQAAAPAREAPYDARAAQVTDPKSRRLFGRRTIPLRGEQPTTTSGEMYSQIHADQFDNAFYKKAINRNNQPMPYWSTDFSAWFLP